ncbi:MAG: hypothetical protein Q7J35_14180 [Candidatus Methanoperedens sp.]|nr:hypothetical protein [Candidatus Methanoperedens sp.]
MIFNESDESQKLLVSVYQLRKFKGSDSLEAMVDMINSALNICMTSIKEEHPGISDRQLIKSIKEIYRLML